jgi:hypothetical protein
VDHVSQAQNAWGWLLNVEGERAIVASGWYNAGVDIYRLASGSSVYERSLRTSGWGASSLSRQDNTLYITSGDWGVQTIDLQ